jgi:hypothetical protein
MAVLPVRRGDGMSLHSDLERVALLGWRLIPVTRKRAGFWKGYLNDATHDLDTLAAWSREYPGCNWSVVPEGSGVWALDVDVPGPDHDADGAAWLAAMVRNNGPLPVRPHGRSGGGGHLLVFRDTGAPIKCQSGYPAPGIDPRARRVQFTIAPSIHRNGTPYRWHVAPWEVAPPEAPGWLQKAVAPPPAPPLPARPRIATTDTARRVLGRCLDRITCAGSGTRNATLNREAFTAARFIAAGLLDQREAVAALYAAGLSIGLDRAEARATVKSGVASGLRYPIEAAHA